MTTEDAKRLSSDTDGLITYEYMANHIAELEDDLDFLVDNLMRADRDGQMLVSAARYLHASDSEAFGTWVERLIDAAIDRDREHRYIGQLLDSIYGPDYADNAGKLCEADRNFRRIYQRIFPNPSTL